MRFGNGLPSVCCAQSQKCASPPFLRGQHRQFQCRLAVRGQCGLSVSKRPQRFQITFDYVLASQPIQPGAYQQNFVKTAFVNGQVQSPPFARPQRPLHKPRTRIGMQVHDIVKTHLLQALLHFGSRPVDFPNAMNACQPFDRRRK